MSRGLHAQSSATTLLVAIAGTALLLIYAKALLIPLSFALTLSFLLVPVVSWLERKGASRTLAVLVASAIAFAVLGAGALMVSQQIVKVAETLPANRANILKRIDSLHTSSSRSLGAALAVLEDVSESLIGKETARRPEPLPVEMTTPRSASLFAAERLAGQAMAPIGQIGIILIFTIYMLMNREGLRHRLLSLAGMTHINLMTRALDDATQRISQYLILQLQVNACYGILFGLGLWALGVPQAVLWGVIAGVIRIVPFVGTLIGMLLPLLLAIAISPTWWHPVGVIALFVVIESLLTNLIEPWLFSERTGISSLALLASAIFWSMLWGWPGLILSTPLTVCLVVLGRYVPQLSFLHNLLGTNAKLSAAAHMYERLLAMDQLEVWDIAEQYLETASLADLYDHVVLPVLALAQEDKQKGALDTAQSRFLQLSMTELIARLADYQGNALELDERSSRSFRIEPKGAPSREFAVVCLSASRASTLPTTMLAQLLEHAGHQTLTVAADRVSDEILSALRREPNTVIFISALPPFAFAQARAVYQRVRELLPNNRIAIALWKSEDDGNDLIDRFGPARPNAVVSTLTQAVKQVEAWNKR